MDRSRMKPVNEERSAWLRANQFGPPGFREWICSLPCIVPGCGEPSEPCHATSRGAGGDWTKVVPMCHGHHEKQHRMGIKSFERYIGFALLPVAEFIQDLWERRQRKLQRGRGR